MTTDLETILESKRIYRRKIANQPVSEKLVLLEKLRDRAIEIRGITIRAARLREEARAIQRKLIEKRLFEG